MRVRLVVRNQAALAANFYAADRVLQAQVKATVAESARRAYAYAYPLVPVDKGNMQARLKVTTSPDGYAYELGWDEADFVDFARENPKVDSYTYPQLEVQHYFYPAFVVLGTEGRAPNDPLTPAFAMERQAFDAALRRDLSAAAKRLSARGR